MILNMIKIILSFLFGLGLCFFIQAEQIEQINELILKNLELAEQNNQLRITDCLQH